MEISFYQEVTFDLEGNHYIATNFHLLMLKQWS